MNLATQVGHPYSAAAIEKDVRRLWSSGRFEDIRVETAPAPGGTAVIFQVVEKPQLRLHQVRLEPSTFGLRLPVQEGKPVDRMRAHEIARLARQQLQAQGYADAQVAWNFAPYAGKEVDLQLTVTSGDLVRTRQVRFAGDAALDPKELRRALRALRIRRVFRWRLYPVYSPEATESDLARVRSLYLSKGYFDASVRLSDTQIEGKDAQIEIAVDAGLRYRVRHREIDGAPASDVCSCLLAARREAERQGILDFSAGLDVEPVENDAVDLAVRIDRGPSYTVGRINFTGNHHYSEAMLRRNFVLDEGQVFDQSLLRKSLTRLNRSSLFEPVAEGSIVVAQNENTGVADVSVRLTERKRGAWNISGPMGPASFAGPLQASLSARLPPWGRGMLELSTYTASISLLAFAHPILPFWPAAFKGLWPVLALQRPFSPGEGWKSGFTMAPQMGWRASVLSYASAQMRQRLSAGLAGEQEPDLVVWVKRPAGDVAMLCEPPRPRFAPVRNAAVVGLRLLGALPAI